MKKSSSQSLMSKYTDGSLKKKKTTNNQPAPLMTTYEQRYKGMSKELTDKPVPMTLDEKIEKRTKKAEVVTPVEPTRVSVEIAGTHYLLGCTEEMSASRIKRIASLVNSILSDAIKDNPGLTNSKVTTLALLDACDKLLEARDELNNMKTENMYLQQKLDLGKTQDVKEPTPMEQLAMEN